MRRLSGFFRMHELPILGWPVPVFEDAILILPSCLRSSNYRLWVEKARTLNASRPFSVRRRGLTKQKHRKTICVTERVCELLLGTMLVQFLLNFIWFSNGNVRPDPIFEIYGLLCKFVPNQATTGGGFGLQINGNPMQPQQHCYF